MTRYVSQSTMLHIPLKTTQKLTENCAGVFPVYEGLPKSTSATKSHTKPLKPSKPPKPSKHQETHDHKLGHSESTAQAYLLTITVEMIAVHSLGAMLVEMILLCTP